MLIDLNLPDMSGVTDFHAMRAMPEAAAVPVIALRANAMQGEVARGPAIGFFRCLSKPIGIDAINASVDAALRLRQPEAIHP